VAHFGSSFSRRFLSALSLASALLCATTVLPPSASAQSTGCVPVNYGDGWYTGCSSESTWSYSIGQIKAIAAWNRGFTGAGVTVALFDSGIDTGDNQFVGRISPTPGYDATTGKIGVTTDDMWHGTFVAGIIAADRDGTGMVGVAYNALLLPIRIVNPDGSITLSDAQLAAGINYAVKAGAKVFNNSWNSSTPITQLSAAYLNAYMPQTLAAYKAAVQAGAIIVFAAGNDGASQPGFYAALPADFSYLKPGWIAAVATGSNGKIASYSDRCGSAAAWCLAAPGTSVISVYQRGYASASGTSFAAPQIAGAAAILEQEFPYLTNQQIVQILFQSATKTGIYANKAIYGQGLLNLDAATKPIGTVKVSKGATVTGAASPLSATGSIMGSAFGGGLVNALSGQQMLVLDSFSRGYTVPMSGVVSTSSSFDSIRALYAFGGRDMESEQFGTTRLDFAYAVQQQSGGAEPRTVPGKFYLHSELGPARALDLGYNLSPALAFGAYGQGVLGRGDLPNLDAAAIPYLDLADKGWSAAYATNVSGGGKLKLGVFAGQAKSSPFEDDSYYDPSRDPRMAGIYGGVAEMTLPLGEDAKLGFDGGMILEQSTVLGTMSDGALAFGQNTPTWFGGFTATARLGAGYSLFGGAHMGVTRPASGAGSLIQSASAVTTESFNLGVAKDRVFGERDQAGFVFSQPLRAIGGNATISVPVSRDFFGNVSYAPVTSGLAADGRELDLQGFYKTPVAPGASLDFGAMLRLQPNNMRSAAPDAVAMTSFKVKF